MIERLNTVVAVTSMAGHQEFWPDSNRFQLGN